MGARSEEVAQCIIPVFDHYCNNRLSILKDKKQQTDHQHQYQQQPMISQQNASNYDDNDDTDIREQNNC